MKPNLIKGDIIILNKYIYNVLNPLTETEMFKFKYPQRGDIIIFKHPLNSKEYFIKRIIGLPGEYINYKINDNKIIIYKKRKGKYVKISNNYKKINFNQKTNKYYSFFLEQLENKKYLIILNKDNNIYKKKQNNITIHFKIPKGNYFVMGDNRNNSFDSRYWGCISKDNIKGKMIRVLLNYKKFLIY